MADIQIKKSTVAGKGAFAGRNFKKGEIILRWKPKVISAFEAKQLSNAEKHYICPGLANEYWLMQKPERYINHSCAPNTKAKNGADIAIKDIKKGEELTSDYSLGNSLTSFKCNCQAKNCKGFVKASFFIKT
jgi:SET domain-containing protein